MQNLKIFDLTYFSQKMFVSEVDKEPVAGGGASQWY